MTDETMQLVIYGSSDDLLEVEGGITEEFDDARGQINLLISGPEYGALIVHGHYIAGGTWALGVAPCDEEQPLPDWPISIRSAESDESDYSATLVLEVPVGSEIRAVS